MRLSPSIALLRTQTDERLVRLAREGSDLAFSTIVERHRRAVLAACRRILPDARAEDATQQVFMSAWRALARGDDVRDLRAWLLRIARNTSLNALRVQGFDYDELREGLRAGPAPEEELERRDVIRQTLAGLAALPDRQREVLLRSAVEGTAHADIARDLGLSEGATRQLMLRARTTLRAACTAITPWPLVISAAGSGGGGTVAAGAGGLAAKVGVAAVLAGGVAVGTPAIVHHERDIPRPRVVVPAAITGGADIAEAAERVARPSSPSAATSPADRRGASAPQSTSRRRADDRGSAAAGRDDHGGRRDGDSGRSGPSDDSRRDDTSHGDDSSAGGSGSDDSGSHGGSADDSGTSGTSGSSESSGTSGTSGTSGSDDGATSGTSGTSGSGDGGTSGSSGSSGSGSSGSGSGDPSVTTDDRSGSGSSGTSGSDDREAGA